MKRELDWDLFIGAEEIGCEEISGVGEGIGCEEISGFGESIGCDE